MSSYVQPSFPPVGGQSFRGGQTSRLSVGAIIAPANHNNLTSPTPTIDMERRGIERVCFILQAGANDHTIAFKLQETNNSDGSAPSDIPGKAIVAESGGDEDNKQWMIFLTPGECTKRYALATFTIGNGTINLMALVAIIEHTPGDGRLNLASVRQLVL